jgi:hypothetical protein
MAMRMLTPWKNPRSENLWFRRRVPSGLVGFMGRREYLARRLGERNY